MKTTELKIKRKSLAAEARIIRTEEQKALSRTRFQNAMSSPDMTEKRLKKLGLTVSQLRRVRARLANRANTPVYDAADAYGQYNRLRDHRIKDVRTAARAAHLAHHYIKGDPFHVAEDVPRLDGSKEAAKLRGIALSKKPEPMTLKADIARDVRKFGGDAFEGCTPKDITYWFEGGKTIVQEAIEAEQTAAE